MKKLLVAFIFASLLGGILNAKDKVVLQTNEGNITLKLFPKVAPKACENFMALAKKGYYNGVTFHRVIKGFMIQSGDPTGTGAGGESIWGKPFKDEFGKNIVFDRPYILAMANRGENTNTSQFFITTKPTPWLNGRHTIFGEVIDGFKTVNAIETSETGFRDKPVKDIKILKAVIK